MAKIQLIEDYEHPDGFFFWAGEEFDTMSDPEPDIMTGEEYVEVKTAGEYVSIPASITKAANGKEA